MIAAMAAMWALGGGSVPVANGALANGPAASPPRRVRLAVIGNSDSHAYHDSVTFPTGSPLRGGDRRAWQWTELVARWRGDAIDQGAWGVRGWSPRVAHALSLVGVAVRAPRKQDFAFNVATSGATCATLGAPRGQVAQLAAAITDDAAAWAGGIVLIRIGINDLGGADALEAVAAHGLSARDQAAIGGCVAAVRDAVTRLRAVQPALRFLLVGIADNANWPPNLGRFRGAEAMRHLAAYHDAYDDGVRGIVAATPGAQFWDDRAWFAGHFGGRAPDGTPAYRAVEIGGVRVTVSQGDDPAHLVVADGHAGSLVNALWARDLVVRLARDFGVAVAPVTDAELAAFAAEVSRGS